MVTAEGAVEGVRAGDGGPSTRGADEVGAAVRRPKVVIMQAPMRRRKLGRTVGLLSNRVSMLVAQYAKGCAGHLAKVSARGVDEELHDGDSRRYRRK